MSFVKKFLLFILFCFVFSESRGKKRRSDGDGSSGWHLGDNNDEDEEADDKQPRKRKRRPKAVLGVVESCACAFLYSMYALACCFLHLGKMKKNGENLLSVKLKGEFWC